MKTILISTIAISLWLMTGCGEDFLEKTDPNSLVTSSVFNNYESANQAINGAYTPLKEVDLYGDQIHFMLHQITNEYGLLFQGDAGWNQMKDFSITPDNVTVRAAWNGVSKMVLRANAVIAGMSELTPSADFTQEQKDQLLGQAYFLRGYALFLGVNLFGEEPAVVDPAAKGFPVITSVPESRDAMLVSRANVGAVYEQIVSDWQEAERLLPVTWSGEDVGRATQGAASGFLAKAYLYQEDWAKASTYFEKIINNPAYQLLENFGDNFNGQGENGTESIFEIQYSDGSPIAAWDGGPGHTYATRHAPAELGAFGNVSVPVSTYERIQGDPRVGASIIQPGDFLPFPDTVYVGLGPTDYRPRKFIDVNTSQINSPLGSTFNGKINMPLMRLADVYLMYAEAQNELGNAAVALEYLNKVRRRAYSEPTDATSATADVTVSGGDALRKAIQDERFVELLGEGHRWFDLLRWELADDELVPRGFQPGKNQAMPIPLDEIQLNPEIEQNDEY